MSIEKHGDYLIEFIDDKTYSENSVDNKYIYCKVYKSDDDRFSSKHGIVIFDLNNPL